ncbi:hypothetical protein PMAYCL1PPCAC_11429, partial [Pristionchus mayeri]
SFFSSFSLSLFSFFSFSSFSMKSSSIFFALGPIECRMAVRDSQCILNRYFSIISGIRWASWRALKRMTAVARLRTKQTRETVDATFNLSNVSSSFL